MYNDFWQSIIVGSIKSTNKVKLVLFSKYFFEKEIDNFYCFSSIEKDQNVINKRKEHGLLHNKNNFFMAVSFFEIKMTISLCSRCYLDIMIMRTVSFR